jgi:hypothetical protein
VFESAAPGTTNQNATHGIYNKDKRWLGSPYRHTKLKCSMKLYLKVIGCSCYTCLPRRSPAAAQTALQKGAPGTRPKAQRLLTIATPKTWSSTYTYMQTKTKDKKQYNIT